MIENRSRHIGVMITASLYDKLDAYARRRKGRASVSSAANDILTSFFDCDASQMTQSDTNSEADGGKFVMPSEGINA